MSRKIDLTGKKFGRLTVMTSMGANKHGSMTWQAKCACGAVVVVDGQHLRKGAIVSCGCSKQAPRDAAAPPAVRGARWVALGGGGHTLVDAEDAAWVKAHLWHTSDTGYARRFIGGRAVRLHREVLAKHGLLIEGREVDHANGDRLDNRKANLRGATRAENQMNRTQMPSALGLRGVTQANGKFVAKISAHGARHYLGRFATKKAAVMARDLAARKLHGQFARLNNR